MFSSDPVNFNLAYPFYRHSVEYPLDAALILDGKSFTYSKLASCASRIAAWLNDGCNTRHGQRRVVILASRSLETYAGILGACWAGATYIPINVKIPAATLKCTLECADPDALIIDKKGAKRLAECGMSGYRRVLQPFGESLSDDFHVNDELAKVAPMQNPVAMSADEVAYVIFTSGTTGIQRG
ncbi:MAG: AMP-binding protein [Candidatus Riflebacteria bacterium]|nr:AMP-binding protein [Candidatus Riflebacteria bacterium]